MFEINGMSSTPVYEQLIEQIEKYIASGILKASDQLPSVRNLSITLSLNPNTVQKAIGDLTNRGIICGVPGKGIFVTESALDIIKMKGRHKLGEFSSLVKELALAGVSREEVLAIIEKEYGEGGDTL